MIFRAAAICYLGRLGNLRDLQRRNVGIKSSVLFTAAVLLAIGCGRSGKAVDQLETVDPTKPASREDGNWASRNAAMSEAAKQQQWDLVFLGDSITQAWESDGSAVWQEVYGHRNAANLGIGGDETHHLAYRIQNGNLSNQSPKLAVVLIGTNDLGNAKQSPAEVVSGIKQVVEFTRQACPETKILLLGVFPRGEFSGDLYRGQIEQINLAISSLADWQNVFFLDIGQTFLSADGSVDQALMPDFLHLSERGYQLWAEAMEPCIAELMGESTGKVSLFNGESLEGWTEESGERPPKGWSVVDGTLAVTGWGEDAFTTEQFGDFEFHAQWKMPRKGNGGIFYRVADYKYIWLGPEYQLQDDLTRSLDYDADNSCGANVDLYGPERQKSIRPHGEWNDTRIVVVGNHAEHWLNGRLVLEYDFNTEDWNRRVKDSKFARLHPYFGQPQQGKFKLENHVGSRLQFRDIWVKEL